MSTRPARATNGIRAVALYKDGLAKRLAFAGSWKVPGGNREVGVTAGIYMANLAMKAAVPKEHILRSSGGRRKYGAIQECIRILRFKGFYDLLKTVILIGCPGEMKIIYLMARNQFSHHTKLLCCPQQESATIGEIDKEWMRRGVRNSMNFLYELDSRGMLPPNWRDHPPF